MSRDIKPESIMLPDPIPLPGDRHRDGVVAHRGRSIRYVCASTSPGDRAKLVDLLAELLKRPPS